MKHRILQDTVKNQLQSSPALLLLGPRGVGKTTLARQFAKTTLNLEIPSLRQLAQSQPDQLLEASEPIFIDEWHLAPEVIGAVRRKVDESRSPGRFLLAGSQPDSMPHSGVGRLSFARLRPMTLQERGVADGRYRFSDLTRGLKPQLGRHDLNLADYAREIVRSGFPGFLELSERAAQQELKNYIEIMTASDSESVGAEIRRPQLFKRWLQSYASSSGTITSLENIRSAGGFDSSQMPSKVTALNYLEILHKLFIADPVEAFPVAATPLKRVSGASKHFLADPGLSAALLSVSSEKLLQGFGASGDKLLLAQLFENLVALHLKTFAELTGANLWHYREWDGRREIDFVLEMPGGPNVLIEVKLSNPQLKERSHLNSFASELMSDAVKLVITAGKESYTNSDGSSIVPLGAIDFAI